MKIVGTCAYELTATVLYLRYRKDKVMSYSAVEADASTG